VKQSVRDVITGELTLEYFANRLAEGWKIASVEWFRETQEATVEVGSQNVLNTETALPYGFRLTDAGILEENALEATVLLLILDQIVKEKRITEIAAQLNAHGFSTRKGMPWSASDVFELLPRLIEAGPSLLNSAAWQQLRAASQDQAARPN
jgi:hypothetical protein